MRKTFVATAVATIISAGAFLSSGANAMTSAAPAGLRTAIDEAQPVEQVRHRCFRARTHRGFVCPRHGRRLVVAAAPVAAYPYWGYPAVSVGFGPVWGGWGWGWGGHRTVVHRHVHRRHVHRGHRGRR